MNQYDEQLVNEPLESGSNNSASDDQLIERTLNGERAAYGELMIRYQDRLYNTAVMILHDADEARDVVQETFLQGYANLSGFRRESRFYSWLYRIAFNVAVGVLRRRKRSIPAGRISDAAWEALPGRIDSPDKRHSEQESAQLLWQGIEQIPLEYRKVLILREIDGASYEEIAETADIPIGTVRSRLFRARLLLRDIILRFEQDLT